MKYYCTTFSGINPVGACAIAVAENMRQARNLIWNALSEELKAKNTKAKLPLFEMKCKKPEAFIVLNGEY